MGIPIRLNVGPRGDSTISLDAVSLDVSVDRNVSAFPTPNNILNRMAIDTNVPSVEIEIAGILQDDEYAPETTGSSADYGDQILMNFAATAPTTNNHWNYMTHLASATSRHHQFLEFHIKSGEGFGISASSKTIDVLDRYVIGATEDEAFDNMVGNKLFDKYGRTIGTISAVTFAADNTSAVTNPDGTALTFQNGPNTNRVDTITLSSTAIALDEGEIMYYGVVSALEDQWIDRCFALYPNYWKVQGQNPAYTRPATPTAIIFKFTSTASHLSGGSARPTIVNTANSTQVPGTPSSGRHAVIEIPIGGVMYASTNNNPASTLALLVKEAIDLSSGTRLSVESKPLMPGLTTSYPADAFDAQVSGGTVLITQKYDLASSQNVQLNVSPSIYDSPANTSEILRNRQFFEAPNQAIQWDEIALSASTVSADGKQKSAGDKVQDLLGIISNATKGRDLIRGIQIPYDSLITSSGVTGTARNFFLTFGEQNLDDKGSLNNNREASLPFVPGIAANDIGGEPSPVGESNWLSQFGLGGVANATESLLSFTGNLIKDSFVSLATAPHGNDGGIRILPEKLHVRYDAGHNYYAFNLKLLASDFVIGV
tara:strand:+ start:2311 stop:4107 length:1797 start_codon:yes stop_codon:yes gene_type:complete